MKVFRFLSTVRIALLSIILHGTQSTIRQELFDFVRLALAFVPMAHVVASNKDGTVSCAICSACTNKISTLFRYLSFHRRE